MQIRASWFVVAGLSLLIAAPYAGAGDKLGENVKCPISGKPAKAKATAKYHGKDVYFCCKNCVKAFRANPDKFATKANAQLVQTGQAVQVACPLSGKKCKAGTEVEVDGVKVAFCCNHCQEKVAKADADGKRKLVFANLEKGFTLQTKCPVSGKPIRASVSVDYKGKKVYFCCPGCPKAFSKNPEKYAAKL